MYWREFTSDGAPYDLSMQSTVRIPDSDNQSSRNAREELIKAKDLMIPLQEYLKPGTTLREAAKTLRTAKRSDERSGVKGLPVLDEKGKMVGFLSIGDILKSIFPAYMNLADLGDFTWDGMVEDMARRAEGRNVSEMMTEHVITAIGASANVIVVGMSEKMGKKISFGRFMLYGMPLTAMTVAVATLYVWLRYYVLKI